MVPGFIRPPGLPFDVPEDPATPMIMIATGTGLSPFRDSSRSAPPRAPRHNSVPPC